jgi:hypothetical protein
MATLLAVAALLGSSLSQWRQEASPPPAPSPVPVVRERVRVEVLNGGGRPGVAREATGALRDLGFDVVYYGNAGTFNEDSSVVLDRMGRPDAARWAAQALGIRTVISEPDSGRYVDVTVRLGPDWSPPVVGEVEEEVPLSWWDPRRLWRRGDSVGTINPMDP